MANEKPQDVLKANVGAPEAAIPDLKKKEKERKKAGAAWSGARGAAGEFSGATGGTVARAAASAAAEAGMVGAEGLEGGGIWAAITRFLAGLAATALGRVALAAAAFLMVAAAGLLGYAMFKGNNNASVGSPDLGGITDSMKVHDGGSDRLGVASRGEIRFDPQAAAKPAEKPAAAPPPKADDKAAPAAPVAADKPVPSGQLAHNLSGAQLSSSLGGGDFGSKNIFNGGSNAVKFGSGIGKLPPVGASKGKLSAMQASNLHATAAKTTAKTGSATRALGQLKLTNGLSQQGQDATSAEGAATRSQDAFDQNQTTGGGLTTPGAPGNGPGGGGTVAPLGGGAPNTGFNTDPTDPSGGNSVTDPNIASTLAQIQQLANQAMTDMKTGMMLMLLGAILIGIGTAMLFPPMDAWGLALIAAGLAMVMMGAMDINKSNNEKQQATNLGNQLASSIGDTPQGDIINSCTSQAVQSGTQFQDCQPPAAPSSTINTAQQNADTGANGISTLQTWSNTQPTLGGNGSSGDGVHANSN